MHDVERDIVDEEVVPLTMNFQEEEEESEGENNIGEYKWVDKGVLKMHTIFTSRGLLLGMAEWIS